jgi:ribosomal protein S18 acetylase RimI-like enzyme
LSPKHPFHKHAHVEHFLAVDENGEMRGRISAIANHAHNEFWHDRVGFFGFFESENNQAVADALFDAAAASLKNQGLDTMRGPMSFSTNEECGLLVDGFDTPPAVMMTHNPPYYAQLVDNAGFIKAQDLLAYQMFEGQLSDRVRSIGKKLEERMDFKFRLFNTKDFKGEVERFKEIYNSAWEQNWGFVPMTDEEIDIMAEGLKMVLDPRLIQFAETPDGKAVGFILALPDLNVIFKKLNGKLFPFGIIRLLLNKHKVGRARVLAMGVLPEYRKKGIDTVLYMRAYEIGTSAGYAWGEFSWVLEDNELMNSAARSMGSHAYKTWRIYDRKI